MPVQHEHLGELSMERKTDIHNGPCRGCRKREVGCHGKCPEYAEWKRNREEYLERRREQIDLETTISRIRMKSVWENRRKKNAR